MSNKSYYVSAFSKDIMLSAIKDSFKKLNPKITVKNPVMFVVEIGSVITTAIFIKDLFIHDFKSISFVFQITLWLWFTVLFANFAESISEGRGKAQADSLRRTKTEVIARLFKEDGKEEKIKASMLRKGDIVIAESGDTIPADGEIIEGIASVDESAITGESAPVIRESGGDRSAVTGGTKVLSDKIIIRVTSNPGENFIDKMISLVEGASRQKTPNEIALNILLVMLTAIFLVVVVTLVPMAGYFHGYISPVILVALLVCLIPTTIGALLSAIGISGMDRLVKHNVIAMSGKAVEAAGDVNTLLLDKTGTITFGNRMAVSFIPSEGSDVNELADYAQLSSLSDETPEGRSIVTTTTKKRAVSITSKILRAISLGVFCLDAPSTSDIILSIKFSPGFDVTLIIILSDKTFVPPVTALLSPPLSLITGADSPVMADSSTEAIPSIISPSAGIVSPDSAITTSPFLKRDAFIFSSFPSSLNSLAITSVFVLLRLSACALPLPSEMLSAKLANRTVNQSHNVICRTKAINLKSCINRSLINIAVVITEPISTTNMTGFLTKTLGLSFLKESFTADNIISLLNAET